MEHLSWQDQHRLRGLQRKLQQRQRQGQPVDRIQTSFDALLSDAEKRVAERLALKPAIQFPEQLPVSSRRGDILDAIKSNQVVVVAGETGSGKTTQLPKICLQAGLGIRGQIGHTQPRRLAAQTVADRLADELECELGDVVSYQVRFEQKGSRQSLIKLQTDGVLLNEIQNDPLLRRYDALIIDEAHERSLNIDFLLGYLKRLLPRRPELKLIITSATIDTQRFKDFFSGAPVIEVSGRSFPVEILYRGNDDIGLNERLLAAVDELLAFDAIKAAPDILCFLATESEILEAQRLLRGRYSKQLEVLPLYSRLPAKQQRQVFTAPKKGLRRLILATNVAETSLTVPRIGFVIDGGDARISRYSYHSKIQQLPIESVSQASASQRSGRCGRIAPGTCIRLYSQDDFEARPAFTEAEILRTNLAAILLRLLSLGVAEPTEFEFLDQPDDKLIRDGLRLLQELQAIHTSGEHEGRLTGIGKTLARLPLEPRLGRLILAGGDGGCLDEMLIIAAALSVPEPRERPAGKEQQADQAQKAFADSRSDFMGLLKLWRQTSDWRRTLDPGAYRKRLRQHFLSFQAIADWQDVHGQLTGLASDVGLKRGAKKASYEQIHRALLTGFVSNIGLLGEKNHFTGVRQRQFRLFPGSGLAAKPPQCIVAAEIVATGAVYARRAAQVKNQWVVHAAKHLINTEQEEPFFDVKSGEVKAFETSILYGLRLADRKEARYRPHKEIQARDVFVEQALVQRQWQGDLPLFVANERSIRSAQECLSRVRRPEILCIEDALAERFAELPDTLRSVRNFEQWYRKLTADKQVALELTVDDCLVQGRAELGLEAMPDSIESDGQQYAVRYRYAPGKEDDGLEVLVPEPMAAGLPDHAFDTLVPGWLGEKCIELIKGLPKRLRKPMVPVAATVQRLLPAIASSPGPLLHRLERILQQEFRVEVSPDDWHLDRVPDHLFARRTLVAADGTLGNSRRWRDAVSVTKTERPAAPEPAEAAVVNRASNEYFLLAEYDGRSVTADSYPDLPLSHSYTVAGIDYLATPTLLAGDKQTQLVLFHDAFDSQFESRWALAGLFQQALAQLNRRVKDQLFSSNSARLHLSLFPERDAFQRDCVRRVFYQAFECESALPKNQSEFNSRLKQGRQRLDESLKQWQLVFEQIIEAHFNIAQARSGKGSGRFDAPLADVDVQLDSLLWPGCLARVATERLRHYPRYLKALTHRVQRLREQQGRDKQAQEKVQRWDNLLSAHVAAQSGRALLQDDEIFWMLQEYRVSLFAQGLRTAVPVSETRLKAAWERRFDKTV